MIPKRRMMQNIRETGLLSSPSRKSRLLNSNPLWGKLGGGLLPLFYRCTPRHWILLLVIVTLMISFHMWQRLTVTIFIGTAGYTNTSFNQLTDNINKDILSTSPVSRSVFSSWTLPTVSTSTSVSSSSINDNQLLYGASSPMQQTFPRRSRLRSKLQEQGILTPIGLSTTGPTKVSNPIIKPPEEKKIVSTSSSSSSTTVDTTEDDPSNIFLDEKQDTEDWDNVIEKLKETQGKLNSDELSKVNSPVLPLVPPVSPLVPKVTDSEPLPATDSSIPVGTVSDTSSSTITTEPAKTTTTSSSIMGGFQWITDFVTGSNSDQDTSTVSTSSTSFPTDTSSSSSHLADENSLPTMNPYTAPSPFNGLFLPRSFSFTNSFMPTPTDINIFNETTLLKLVAHRKWAEPDAQSIARAVNWVSDDRILLVDAKDDPDAGIAFTIPDPPWIDPSLLDSKRVKHELNAELSIMIPTAPRIMAPWVDDTGATPSYWITRADCRGEYVLRLVNPLVNASTFDLIKHFATECEADGKCVAFDANGNLYSHYDQSFCSIVPVVSSGITKPLLGERDAMYFKEPPTIAVLPQRFNFKEWPILSNGDIRPSSRFDEAPTTAWWSAKRTDIIARDLRRVDPSNSGKYLNEDEQKQYLRAVCLADERCMGFSYPSGYLKYSVDVSDIHASTRVVAELWSRVPIPPLDYIVLTVIGLTRQIEEASGGQCNFGLTSPYDLLRDEGITLPEKYNISYDIGLLSGKEGRISTNYTPAMDMYNIPPEFFARLPSIEKKIFQNSYVNPEHLNMRPFPDGVPKITDEEANGHYGILGPRPHHPFIPSLRTHLYVMDTGSLELHNTYLRETPRKLPRSALDDYYWFRAFSWLRRKYGHSPCISFVPATSYVRSTETSQPNHGRGLPDFHTDNRGKNMPRQQTKQLLDFTSALRFTAARSPKAHLLVWEDDCFACSATIDAYSRAISILSLAEPKWGGIKVGNGGSGLLFNADLVSRLLVYLQTRRGSDNVDVSMWRFLHSGGWPDYISYRTRSAHRGLTSSFRISQGSVWGRVKCSGELDFYWGFYGQCNGVTIRDRLTQAIKLQAAIPADAKQNMLHPYLLSLINNSSAYIALNFLFDWQCSTHSDLIQNPLSPPTKAMAPPPPMIDAVPPHPSTAEEVGAFAASAAAKVTDDIAAAVAAAKAEALTRTPALP